MDLDWVFCLMRSVKADEVDFRNNRVSGSIQGDTTKLTCMRIGLSSINAEKTFSSSCSRVCCCMGKSWFKGIRTWAKDSSSRHRRKRTTRTSEPSSEKYIGA